jgi:hypothetical protein
VSRRAVAAAEFEQEQLVVAIPPHCRAQGRRRGLLLRLRHACASHGEEYRSDSLSPASRHRTYGEVRRRHTRRGGAPRQGWRRLRPGVGAPWCGEEA